MTGASSVTALPVEAVEDVAAGTSWLWFPRRRIACEPGQFFMLSAVEPSTALFLGRPLSIADVADERLGFLVRALGSGTAWLRSLRVGAPVRLVGPLGRPFALLPASIHRIVAGGIGLAPFFYLARGLRERRPGERIELVYGERTAAAHVELDRHRKLFDAVDRCTDDGTLGAHGTVIDRLAGRWGDLGVAWYGCGPQRMLAELAGRLEDHAVEGAQFSLEERMACGFGVCQACIVPRRDPPPRYSLLCTEGPVLDPRSVVWDAS